MRSRPHRGLHRPAGRLRRHCFFFLGHPYPDPGPDRDRSRPRERGVRRAAGSLAGIGLSTSGRQVIAYLCDGKPQHVSLAQWFQGPVTSTGIDITNAHGAHLVATVSAQAITGTSRSDGRSAPFTARLIPAPGSGYGLFRSEETFNGVRYLGGWIIPPPQLASAPAGTERSLPG